MLKIFALSLLICAAQATTLRIACGSAGGIDTAGALWGADTNFKDGASFNNTPSLPVPYRQLRYGTSFSYRIPVAPGQYKVSLVFLEPNKAAAGLRVFSVTVNGAAVLTNYDIYATTGVQIPPAKVVDALAPDGFISISLAATVGNAVISGIQIDSVDPPPPPPPAAATITCERTLGDGVHALGWPVNPGSNMAYPLWACENTTTAPLALLRFRCRSDAPVSAAVMLLDATGRLQNVTNSISCMDPNGTEAAVTPGSTYLPGQVLLIVATVVSVNDAPDAGGYGNARQVLLTAIVGK